MPPRPSTALPQHRATTREAGGWIHRADPEGREPNRHVPTPAHHPEYNTRLATRHLTAPPRRQPPATSAGAPVPLPALPLPPSPQPPPMPPPALTISPALIRHVSRPPRAPADPATAAIPPPPPMPFPPPPPSQHTPQRPR
ncbi:hypothetical protein H0H92_010407 [Tricholoma furcatifolium]|nr:hypothetical protein H0H92_010407 [Tricholoma furcatifolium]